MKLINYSSCSLIRRKYEHADKPHPDGMKERVKGARRVWGTMSVCTASVMKSAIDKCYGIKSVRVRRKMSGRCWWFVLHGKEDVLCSL